MALTQFIKDLLYLNDKLIIPGFGGFVAQYVPAQIHTEKNILTPPGKYFIFDTSLTENDDVFATYISQKQAISLPEARLAVKELVRDLKQKLNEGNTLLIDEVGYIYQDDNKVIRFKREESSNFHPESFGLQSVAIKSNNQVVQNNDDFFVPAKRKSPFVKILIIFLLINVLGALSAFIYWKYADIRNFFHRTSETKVEAPVADTTSAIPTTADTSELGQYIDTTTNIKNALRYEESKKPENIPAQNSTSDKKYYIIAGSFQSYPKAEIHAKRLTKEGFKPEIIEFGQELFRISVGEFTNKDEAVNQLELIKCKKGAEKAWLLAK